MYSKKSHTIKRDVSYGNSNNSKNFVISDKERKEVFDIRDKIYISVFTVIMILLLTVFIRVDDGIHKSVHNDTIAEDTNIDNKETEKEKGIKISTPSGFYDEDIQITVMPQQEGIVFYTMDGSSPASEEGGSTYRYKEPIILSAKDEESVEVYRFKAVFDDGTESDVVTNTYFMGKDIGNRYDTMVISLAAEYDDLYGEERGIFVEGKLRADWLEQHPGEEVAYDTPANFNVRGRESERNVHIEIFERDKNRVISQNGSIRISGHFTRWSEQKSFKLFARKEYDEQYRFRFPLFDDMRTLDGGSIINKYKTLKIRNTGNDRSEAFIRDELGVTLAGMAGFQDTQSVRPVSVYINGIYQGLYWMHSTYDEEYFEERYGDYEGEMVLIGDSERDMITDSEDETANYYAVEYSDIYGKYSSLDLTDDRVYEELTGYIDIENYLQYYALEIYMANRDWPYNNLKAYRYVANDDEGYINNSVFDGRYRYLLYDVDSTMGAGAIREILNPNQSFETITLIEEREYAPLFVALMKREESRNYFISYVCDLLNGAFSTENVDKVLADMHRLRKNEMQEYIEESIKNPDLPEIGAIYLEMQMDCIRAWAETAPESMLEGMRQKWQLGDIFTINMFLTEGEGVQINGITVTEPQFRGRYLTGCATRLKPVLPSGKKFSYWEINGEVYTEEEILISTDMLIDNTLNVVLYSEETGLGLALSEIKAKGKEDYIILMNSSNREVNTRGYCIMDGDKTSHINYLDETVLAPGESILIGCKNYNGSDAFMKVNFNIKKDEEVMLFYGGSEIIEKVRIPDLGMEQGVYKKNMVTGEWKEERRIADGS